MEPYHGGDLIFLDDIADSADRKQEEEKGEALFDSGMGAEQSSPQPKQEQPLSLDSSAAATKPAPPSIDTTTTAAAPMAVDTPTPAAATTEGILSTETAIETTTNTTTTVALETSLEIDPNRKSRKDFRRKNRRRLHRLLKKPGALPSFLRVIEERKKVKKETNAEEVVVVDDDSDDDDFLLEPPIVVIDVDEYLGLKKKRKFAEAVLSASLVPSNPSIAPVTTSSSSGVSPAPVSSSIANLSVPDGWYEGSCSMAMLPEDTFYLTENQQFIRKNMEFFTATADVLPTISNRKTPVVVGRVGFRCLHCARALREGVIQRMPPASVSFPKNFVALYNLTIQKQQMHIDDCPHVPSSLKWNKPGAKPRKRQRTELPATVYWQISCKRLGIVELENNTGLRFGRDPKLEPLPFETIKSEVERDHPELVPRLATPTRAISSTVGTTSDKPRTEPLFSLPTAVADVMEELNREKEDLTTQLITKEEATMLSDFMLLTIQQATFCHAVTEDFATRGKKTRLMRLGYAGFCCRHCKRNYSTGGPINIRVFQNSCRSFSSSRDNVGSAMSNSFVLHLLKCDYTPSGVKHALQSLKKLHAKQMQRLPYGSQSQVFAKIWERIRVADKPKEEGVPDRPIITSPRVILTKTENDDDDEEYMPDAIASSSTNRHSISPQRSSSRQPHIPPVNDKEYAEVLKNEEEHWEPSQNDNLIQRQDRGLISDFVFLCMRQLKVVVPTGADFRLNRPRNLAGVCCRHCLGASNSRGGKSFPSAPDNIASILNVTIYKHMMSCPKISLKLKRTIDTAKKVHTQQCSSLPYGSQRRYFEKLFARLSRVPMDTLANTRKEPTSQNGSSVYSTALQKCEFARTKISDVPVYWQCLKCRMVPYDYRAPGSIFFSTPSVGAMEKHRAVCQNDGICWDAIDASMKKLSNQYGEELINRESFVNLIRSVVGNDVCDTYVAILRTKDRLLPSSLWRRFAQQVDFDRVEESFSLLREDLNLPPASLAHCADFLEFLQRVSCNFQVPPEAFSRVKTEATPALEHVDEIKSNDIDQSTKPEYSSLDHVYDAEVPSENISGEVSHSLSPKATLQDSQPKDDREQIITPTLNGNEETSMVNQGLTWDQGINVMENVEAGQFDDA